MRNRKIHVKLPLKIPQNIIDCLVAYNEWRKNPALFHEERKTEILKAMDKACVKWHLFEGYGACVGHFTILTKVAIEIVCNTARDNPIIEFYTKTSFFDSETEREEGKVYKGKTYVYDWDDYQPIELLKI